MSRKGIGHRVLTIQVTSTLGPAADDYDINAIVDAIVATRGFVDIDEIEKADYWELVHRYPRIPATGMRVD